MEQGENELGKRILGYKISELGITEILLRDFDHSWEYYKFNLEERRDIIYRIYNFIGFPIFVLSIILYLIENGFIKYNGNNPPYEAYTSTIAGSVICLVLSIYGFLQIIALANESSVSRDYLDFLNNVRNYIGLNSPELRPFLKFNQYEMHMRIFLYSQELELFRKGNYDSLAAQVVSDNLNADLKQRKPSRIVRFIREMKSVYWRSASAIFIVSSSISLTVVLFIYAFGKHSEILFISNSIVLFGIGFLFTICAFVAISKLFRQISGVQRGQK